MAIARKPNSKPKSPMDEAADDAFIAGAAKPKAEPIATEADAAGTGARPRKSPVLTRSDPAFVAEVDPAATAPALHPSARIPTTAIRGLEARTGWGGTGQGGPG